MEQGDGACLSAPGWQNMVAERCRYLERRADRQGEDAEDDAYHIGRRDGFAEAVQLIDELTGGDGEYRYCTVPDERHCPDPEAMILRLVARFNARTDTPAQNTSGGSHG